MNRLDVIAGILCVTLAAGGCMGEANMLDSDPGTTPPNLPTPNSDPWAACTDKQSCCSAADIICVGDPDNNPTCKCSTLWECPNPKKCFQDKPVPPGGGTWSCSWSESGYTCEGNPPKAPAGGAGWSCSFNGAKNAWVCTKSTTPNPTNKPGGTAYWKCKVEGAKLTCERPDTPNPTPPPPPPPPGKKENNCGDGIDNDGDGKVDCKDEDCPNCKPTPPPSCPPGVECCDGKDNDGDGKIDEGNVCDGVAEPCPPGAYQSCDCYCGVHRKCQTNGTWGPCKVDGNGSCAVAKVTSQSQCPQGSYCDYGKCVFGWMIGSQCKKHSDCPTGKVCDLGDCIKDPYKPCP
jgi:hypothetical protein